MLTKTYKKTLVAVALGGATSAVIPVQAATWNNNIPAGNIEITGAIKVIALPGVWEWAVGSKTDFATKLIDTPMEPGQKVMKLKLADDMPILAGRTTSSMIALNNANISVSYPQVTVPAGTYAGVAQDNTRPLGLLLRAPLTLVGAPGNVVGYATFEASGAGMLYVGSSTPTAGSTFTPRALAPANASNNLCSGLVGHVANDNADAITDAKSWLGKLDSGMVYRDDDVAADLFATALLINPALDPANKLTAGAAGAKFTGRYNVTTDLMFAQCGVGIAKDDNLILTFNNVVNADKAWEVKLSPTVQYN